MMGLMDVKIARQFYDGNDIRQVAAALAQAEGYHVIVWLKKGGSWENDRLGCCKKIGTTPISLLMEAWQN